MADEIEIASPAPVASPEVTPSASPEPAIVETPVETPSAEPIHEEPAAAPAAEGSESDAQKTETLLGSEKKIEEAKSEEKTPEAKTEEKPSEEVVETEIPVYEPFVLPEGVTVETEKMGEYTKTLAEFEKVTKAPHEEVQKLGQQFLDRHIEEMQRYTESLTNAWIKQKNDWKDSFLKDPEFANRTNTVVNAAIDAIGVYAGNEAQQAEFRKLMEDTGIGNHPAMIRTLSNIMLAKPEPKQLAAPQIATSARTSKVQKMYGKKA